MSRKINGSTSMMRMAMLTMIDGNDDHEIDEKRYMNNDNDEEKDDDLD